MTNKCPMHEWYFKAKINGTHKEYRCYHCTKVKIVKINDLTESELKTIVLNYGKKIYENSLVNKFDLFALTREEAERDYWDESRTDSVDELEDYLSEVFIAEDYYDEYEMKALKMFLEEEEI